MAIPTTAGAELALDVNYQTGKFRLTWLNGDVAFDDNQRETVLSLLIEDESPFTTGRRRGPGPRSVTIDNADAASQIQARAEERLQLAVDDGRLRSFAVSVDRLAAGRYRITVSYVTNTGTRDAVQVPIGH
jgi:hypothetical protein